MSMKSLYGNTVASLAFASSILLAAFPAKASTISSSTYVSSVGKSTVIGCSANDSQCGSAFINVPSNLASTGAVADSVDWGKFATAQNTTQNLGTVASGDSTVTPNGDNITVTSGDSTKFTTYIEGQGKAPIVSTSKGQTITTPGTAWDGSFAAGITVLYTSDGSITLKFTTPLIGLGIDAQIFNSGTYNETLTAYNAAGTILGQVAQSGSSAGVTLGISAGEGTVPFVGISTDATTSDLATNGISYITIGTSCAAVSAGGCISTGGFAIDTSLLYHFPINQVVSNVQTTPEPGTLGLLGVSLIGLGWARRRKRA